jgi:hypothetical protein
VEEPESEPPELDGLDVYTHGVVTSRTLDPAVQLRFGDRQRDRLAVAEAKELAVSILEASLSAEQDAAFVRYLTKEAGMSLAEAGAVLQALRRHREGARGGARG